MERGEKRERKKMTRTRSGKRCWSIESIFHTRNLLARDEEKRGSDGRRRRRPRRGGGCCTGRDSKRRSPSVSLTKFPTARVTKGSTFFCRRKEFSSNDSPRSAYTRYLSPFICSLASSAAACFLSSACKCRVSPS